MLNTDEEEIKEICQEINEAPDAVLFRQVQIKQLEELGFNLDKSLIED